MQQLYRAVRQPWGGATVDLVAGGTVPDGTDAYAVTVTGTRSIPEDATYAQFVAAYDQARAAFAAAPFLGVFHDDVKGTIDFNGAVVVATTAEVDALHAAGHPVDGGAYHFATGNGYWPQGTPAAYTTQPA
jgi:hypothetical protein